MKEYNLELGKVDVNKLTAAYMHKKDYIPAHRGLVIPCHDVFIEYDGGVLLAVRDEYPAKGILWPIGGRIKRGMKTEDSLRKRVQEECNLELDDITELGITRLFWETDPFNHGKGTDNITLMYFGRGNGELILDELNKEPTIVLPEDYTKEFREGLHPCIQNFMDLAIPLMEKKGM